MTVVEYVVGGILAAGAALALYRAVRGPSILDRVLALDVVLAIIGAALVLNMVVHRHLDNLILLVAISLIGFVGSVTVARFVTDRK
ncbi:monovalent cation/H+ antiporter complex subunit F [Arthrobacter burdickii]|jgi:multicomponent Na+:H+ antiporter subunit F|uniref:Monovalent cation/H+ antiporter complex subunit F n=1 Tax=Arthrobacter burdickii TaxID=3035920 RepID=A0ABT8K127_9MICC|nr:monovalent cation/H+ antiporter complex subunit F [Arthrobacter burdickii]MDN4610292.1 monovalent cation/H+ antiporter complex subunit F [Arthrobacter burdickii]